MLDGALRIPFMLRVPGQAAARRSDVCSLVDVAPTLLSLAGIEYCGEHFDGIDLFSDARHSEVYSQFSTGKKGAYTVSSNHDKLVYHAFEDRWYYFDRMPEDTNRYDASNPAYASCAPCWSSTCRRTAAQTAGGSADFFSGKNKFPYGPKRGDHLARREEELARMPAGYEIDI